MRARSILLTALFAVSLSTTPLASQIPGVERTWSPPPNGSNRWDDAANWNPSGVPNQDDKAIVPADSGTIEVSKIEVYQLEVRDSADGDASNNTTLTGTHPQPDVTIKTGAGGAYVGAGCTVKGYDGLDGVSPQPPAAGGPAQRGGHLTVTGGKLTNRGTVRGGDGGDGPDLSDPRAGGNCTVDVAGLDNQGGTIRSGKGGDKVGRDDPCGAAPGIRGHAANAGKLRVNVPETAPPECRKAGTIEVGAAGTWSARPGGSPVESGADGRQPKADVKGNLILDSTGRVEGRHIRMLCSAPLDLTQAAAGAFSAVGGSIRLEATAVFLNGVAPGTPVFQANTVCLAASLVLDPGTTIQDYCGAAAVFVGPHAGAESSAEVFGPERFDHLLPQPANGWNALLPIGNGGWRFDNPTAIPIDPRMGCGAAIVDAQLNGPGPMTAILQSPPLIVGDIGAPLLLEWTQWFAPLGPSQIGVVVVADGVPTPVLQQNQPTPMFDFVQLDITSLVAGADEFHIDFVFQANGTMGHWVVDDVLLRVPEPVLPGQPSQPGIALLGVDDARNANNVPVFFGEPGPYFVDVGIGDTMNLFVQTAPSQFVFLLGGTMMPDQFQLPGIGQLDLLLVPTPLQVGSFLTDPLGNAQLPFLVPPAVNGLELGLQALVTAPGSGLQFTNTVNVRFGD